MIASQVVNGYLSPFYRIFSKPQWENFWTIMMGLMTEWKKSLLWISKRIIHSKDQSTLHNFITKSNWDEKELNKMRLKILNNNQHLQISWDGYFVIDDTLVQKFGKQMEWVGNFLDHTDNKYKNGRSIVALFYVEKERIWGDSGDIVYPIDIRFYYKIEEVWEADFKTKNDLALEMIFEHLPDNKEDYPICLFDSWYSGKPLLSKLDEKNVLFVTRSKANRNIFQNEEKKKISEIFEEIDTDWEINKGINKKTNVKIARGCIEWWKRELTFVKWEFRAQSQSKDENIYFISNIDTDSFSEIIYHYDFRWLIEPWFKDLKQLLGWTEMSFKSSLSTLRMTYLSLLAYTIAFKEKIKNGTTKTIGQSLKYISNSCLKSLIRFAYTLWKRKCSLEQALRKFWF